MRHSALILLTSLSLSVLLFGCSDRGGVRTPGITLGFGSMSFTVNWPQEMTTATRVIPDSTVTIEIVVIQSGNQVGSLTITRPESTGHIDNIPAGQVNVTAHAKDANGTVVAEGSTGVTVVANQNVSAILSLLAMAIGNMQDIDTWGRYKSIAYGINNNGQVVGACDMAYGAARAFLWMPSTGMQDLNTLISAPSWLYSAKDINDDGQIVGDLAIGASSDPHAFFWSPSTGIQDLGTLGGRRSQAIAVNNASQVVGFSETETGYSPPIHAFFWSQSTGMLDIGTLGGMHSSAYDIYDAGQVVGTAGTIFASHAFIWSPSAGMLDLGSLYGPGSVSRAEGINNIGQVVGYSYTSSGDFSVFLWSPSTGMQDLGNLDGFQCIPHDINDAGEIVGYAYVEGSSNAYPFLWSPSTGLLNLGSLGGNWGWAYAINNAGQVVGVSDTGKGYSHAFRWTPTAPMTREAQGQRYIEIHTIDDDSYWFPDINLEDRHESSSRKKTQ